MFGKVLYAENRQIPVVRIAVDYNADEPHSRYAKMALKDKK
jgi:hypothetical protein